MRKLWPLLFTVLIAASCKGQENKAPDIENIPATTGTDTGDNTDTSTEPKNGLVDLHGGALPKGATGRLGSVRMLDRSIRSMVFTADGTRVISTHDDGLQIWNLNDGSRGKVLEMKTPGEHMSVSPNGKLLATSADDSDQILIWHLTSGKAIHQLSAKGTTMGLCFLDNTRLVSAAETGQVVTWKIKTSGKPTFKSFKGEWTEPTAFGCSRSSGWLGIGTLKGHAYVMEAGTETATLLGKATKRINDVAIASDRSSFAFASSDEQIYLWDRAVAADPVRIEAHERTTLNLAFSPDNSRLYSTGGDAWFRIWDPKSNELIEERLGVPLIDAQLMDLSPDGTLIASWSQHSRERGSEAGRWWLWNASNGSQLLEPARHTAAITSIRYSPDGESIATSSEDQTTHVWNTKSTASLKVNQRSEGPVGDIRYSKDGKSIYYAGKEAVLKKWVWESGDETVAVDAVGGPVNRLVVSKDGRTAYTGDQIGRVWSWDLESGNQIQALDRQGYSAIYDLDISPDGKFLAIAGGARIIRVIDLNGGQEVAQLNPGDTTANYSVRFTADGKHLASAGDGHKIQIWNTKDWSRGTTLAGHDGTVRCLGYSEDGTRLVSGGNDELVKVWDMESGKEIAAFTGHNDVISAIAVAPDGKSFATASRDRTALIWEMP